MHISTGRIVALVAGLMLHASGVRGQTFTNNNLLLLPGTPGDTIGPASNYPSTIVVNGLGGVIADINVTIMGVSHTFADDIDILLVGPNGANVMLMAGAGGSTVLTNASFTFDDQALQFMPNTNPPLVSGTYLPSNYEPLQGMPLPAPQQPYGSLLSVFNGINPNGDWRLYVADDCSGDSGSIQGWSLEITLVPAPGALVAVIGVALLGCRKRRNAATSIQPARSQAS